MTEPGTAVQTAGSDDVVGARRGPAEMAARLERHVERGAARRRTRLGEREHLGVRPAGAAMEPPADDPAVSHHDRSDRRVLGGTPEAAPR